MKKALEGVAIVWLLVVAVFALWNDSFFDSVWNLLLALPALGLAAFAQGWRE